MRAVLRPDLSGAVGLKDSDGYFESYEDYGFSFLRLVVLDAAGEIQDKFVCKIKSSDEHAFTAEISGCHVLLNACANLRKLILLDRTP